MKTHKLKTVQPYFEEVWEGRKSFDVRLNDRDFNAGDEVVLEEYDAETKSYGNRKIKGIITYVLKDYPALKRNYVVFSFHVTLKTIG